MNIFTVAATERDNSILADRGYRMEPLCLETVHILNLELAPFASFNVEHPHVCHVGVIRFTTADDHELVDKAASVVSSWTWHWSAFGKNYPLDFG